MQPIIADLHTHSRCSDGKLKPIELVLKAYGLGINRLSITDHDSTQAYEELKQEILPDAISLISGVECTTKYLGRECHLLLYGKGIFQQDVQHLFSKTRSMRVERAKAIITHLAAQGMEMQLDEVRAAAHFGIIGRPHIAQVMVQKGWVGSIQEAFYRYLSDKKVGDFRPEYPELRQVLDFIANKPIASLIAHPQSRFSIQEVRIFKDWGLNGLEVIHPSHSERIQELLKAQCVQLGFMQSGGSDYHGTKEACENNFGHFTLDQPTWEAFQAGLFAIDQKQATKTHE